jgi:hypothetical protein
MWKFWQRQRELGGSEVQSAVQHSLTIFHNSLIYGTERNSNGERLWGQGMIGAENVQFALSYLKGLYEGLVLEICETQEVIRNPAGFNVEYRILLSELQSDKPFLFTYGGDFSFEEVEHSSNSMIALKFLSMEEDEFSNLGRKIAVAHVSALRIDPDATAENLGYFKKLLVSQRSDR